MGNDALRQPALEQRAEGLHSPILPAELQSSIVFTAGLAISATICAASSSVLMSGVCSADSGSTQYTTPALRARSATAAKAFLGARQGRGARLASLDAPLLRRAVHQVLPAQLPRTGR
jgi:hypothetical protein